MAWLAGYTYRKKGAVNPTTAGAQTNYQLKLVVGESSGASGEDVDCESNCQNFPNDIRFTKFDGTTKYDYWIETNSITGTTPNRKVDVWIEFASIPPAELLEFYMYYGKSGDSGESNGGATFNAFDDFGGSSLETIPSSGDVTISANGSKYEAWPAIAKYSNGDLFVTYRTCNTNVHAFCSTGKIVVRKSTDNGQTWGSEVTVVNATNIDDRNPDILIFDDDGTETILIVYDEYDGNTANDKAYSVKSTDGGANWSSKVTIGNGTTKGRPILLSNGKILVPYRLHDTGGYVKVGESNNGGDSWTSYNVTNTHVEETAILELKTNGSYTGKVIALIADDTPSPAFWKVISTDYGHTWGSTSEETQLPCDTDEPIDIIRHSNGHILGAYTPDGERSGTAIYESEDECVTWIFKAYAIKNASVAVGEYPSICEISSTNLIVAWCSNQFGGATSNVYANFIVYPLPTQWSYSGTPTVGSGEVSLNADDLIYGIRFFGYGYAVKSRAKADEQDIAFVHFRDGAAYQNALQIVNSDSSYPNDFDMMLCQPYVGGTSYYNWIDNQLDFRNVYRFYEVNRISGTAKFYQDGNLLHTETTNLPTIELTLGMRVWDSSQASTLIADWIFVHKYSSPEPTWGSWGAAVSTFAGTITATSGITGAIKVAKKMSGTISATTSVSGTLTVLKDYEDFTTFTEVDVGADRIHKTAYHIDHLTYRNETTYMYKDYGTAHFDDFEHRIKVRFVSASEAWGGGHTWLLANDVAGSHWMEDNNKTYLSIFLLSTTGNSPRIWLREMHNGSGYDDTYVCSFNTWYYVKIIKSSTSLTAYIYSDSNYSTLLDTLTLTIHADHTLRYLYGCNSDNDGSGRYGTLDVENFDLGGGAVALAGTISAVSTVSGVIKVSKKLSGAITSTSTLAGILSCGQKIAGTISATSSVSGTLTKTIALAGIVSGISTVLGSLRVEGQLSGVIAATTSVSGSLCVDMKLSGVIAATTSVSGSITITIALSGIISANSSVSGTLSMALKLSGAISASSSLQAALSVPLFAQSRGFYYAKLGSTILTSLKKDSFRITEELNKIPSFEFEISNCAANRAAITAGISDTLTIYRRLDSTDTLMFTGRIDVDAIEYLSLERIRIPGYASYIDLNFRFHQHLNSEDAEDVGKVFDYSGSYTDYTTAANNDTINDVLPTLDSVNDALYIGQGEQFFGMQVKYSTKGVSSGEGVLDSMDSTTNWECNSGMTDITVNTIIKKEGSGALNLIKADIYDPFAEILRSISSTNLASKNVKVWLYLKDITTKNKISRAEINLLDSNVKVSEWHFPVSGLSIGWNLLVVDTESTPNYTENPDLTDICEIQLGVNTNLATDTYAEGDVIADYYHYTTDTGVASVVFEFSKGSDVWSTLDVLDETRVFTEDAGTYYITIPHKPSDWGKDTVNSVKKFWIRARLTAGAYTTSPKLDRIKITNVDVYRVYYFDTAANSIMDDILAGTGYSMDGTDVCPADTISMVGEYETKLRFIAGVANALTWDDGGDKKAYQWWIDTLKKVHLKQERGTVRGNITQDLVILNNVMDYFNLSNRLHFLGNYDGLNQLRAVIEDTSSQDTHAIRELVVPEERYNNYIPLKEAAQKAMTHTKAPLQKIPATLPTTKWLANNLEVGDTVTIHQPRWNIDEQALQIVRADIGPSTTKLDIGISQEHLDGLKAGLQRRLDITGIRMHGSTTLLQFGPETMNYQRVDASTTYPSSLKFEIPSDARYIHKILISWKLGNYRADVTGGEESEGHDHTGHGGAGGAHEHGGYAGAGGAHDSSVLDGGLHTPVALAAGEHDHSVDLDLNIVLTQQYGYLPDSTTVSTSSSHTHTNPGTGYEGGHIHGVGSTGGPSSTTSVLIPPLYMGSDCASGKCVTGVYANSVASSSHGHSNPNTGVGGGHDHSIGSTGGGGAHAHTISSHAESRPYLTDVHMSVGTSDTEPAHNTTINEVPKHPHTAVAIAAHANHVIGTQIAHGDHSIVTQAAAMIDIALGIVEIAGGTVMQLTVNGEDVMTVDGDGTDIVITGFCNTGSNTVELAPIVGSNVKGGATLEGRGVIFIESSKF